MAATILVVEDEPAIQELISYSLRQARHTVSSTKNAEEAMKIINDTLPDLVLLDWMLPGMSGADFARMLRRAARTKDIPIIMLTARADESDKVTGLESGADDYITKPFSPRELLARIKAVLRRTADDRVKAPEADAYAFGDWVLRTGERELVDKDGRQVSLSTGEFNLLLALVTHPKRVLTRDQLLDLSQHRDLGAFERSIDNHISRLRKKIEADPSEPRLIKTVWGGGYTLAAEVRRI